MTRLTSKKEISSRLGLPNEKRMGPGRLAKRDTVKIKKSSSHNPSEKEENSLEKIHVKTFEEIMAEKRKRQERSSVSAEEKTPSPRGSESPKQTCVQLNFQVKTLDEIKQVKFQGNGKSSSPKSDQHQPSTSESLPNKRRLFDEATLSNSLGDSSPESKRHKTLNEETSLPPSAPSLSLTPEPPIFEDHFDDMDADLTSEGLLDIKTMDPTLFEKELEELEAL